MTPDYPTPPDSRLPTPPDAPLPLLTADIEGVDGHVREVPEDFRVEEVPAYAPEGRGHHLFVRFEKTALTTPEAVRRIASALGVDPGEAGWAGLKDRNAVTTQWASFAGADAQVALSATVEGIRVLDAVPHGNKLRTGHLKANRFEVRIAGAAPGFDVARTILDRLERSGMPNYFGEQRFGHQGRNIGDARRWLIAGGRAPRGRFERKLLVSVLQAMLFNDVLANRMRDGLFETAVAGDLLRKEETGGLFVTADLDEAQSRTVAWEVSPTGPMFGDKMRWPEAEALAREEAVLSRWELQKTDLRRFAKYGEGTRRVLRVRPAEVDLTREQDALRLRFVLPKGAFATMVLRELLRSSRGGPLPLA